MSDHRPDGTRAVRKIENWVPGPTSLRATAAISSASKFSRSICSWPGVRNVTLRRSSCRGRARKVAANASTRSAFAPHASKASARLLLRIILDHLDEELLVLHRRAVAVEVT